MIYFTSDLHLGHAAIIRMQKRPFSGVEEMNRVLIENYNSVVNKNDMVYLLGDVCYKLGVVSANEMISKLNGNKILIIGNHDKKYDKSLFQEICDFKKVSLNGTYFALMHYPILSWPHMYRGSIHLHGHIHADGEDNKHNRYAEIRRYDVGVDANNFYPVSVEYIIDFFKEEADYGKRRKCIDISRYRKNV